MFNWILSAWMKNGKQLRASINLNWSMLVNTTHVECDVRVRMGWFKGQKGVGYKGTRWNPDGAKMSPKGGRYGICWLYVTTSILTGYQHHWLLGSIMWFSAHSTDTDWQLALWLFEWYFAMEHSRKSQYILTFHLQMNISYIYKLTFFLS